MGVLDRTAHFHMQIKGPNAGRYLNHSHEGDDPGHRHDDEYVYPPGECVVKLGPATKRSPERSIDLDHFLNLTVERNR